MTLREQLDLYLEDTKGRWPDVAEGSGVGRDWIYKYAQGVIKNPGLERVERILSYAKADGWTPKEAA